eukprot:scaffold82841_cov63-Cyclotella_meneghiniana.AAC.8
MEWTVLWSRSMYSSTYRPSKSAVGRNRSNLTVMYWVARWYPDSDQISDQSCSMGSCGGATKVWCKTIEHFMVYYHCKVHGWIVENFWG